MMERVLNKMIFVYSPELSNFFVELERAMTKERPKQWEKRIVCVDELKYTSARHVAKQLWRDVGRGAEHSAHKQERKQYVKPRKTPVEKKL